MAWISQVFFSSSSSSTNTQINKQTQKWHSAAWTSIRICEKSQNIPSICRLLSLTQTHTHKQRLLLLLLLYIRSKAKQCEEELHIFLQTPSSVINTSSSRRPFPHKAFTTYLHLICDAMWVFFPYTSFLLSNKYRNFLSFKNKNSKK